MSIITVSRQFGSGGSVLAARVAEALGWPLLDNSFVDAVARGAGVSPADVAAREERVPSLTERLLNALALGSPEAMPTLLETTLPLSEARLLAVTCEVIEQAAAHGPVVIVGRGAQAVLAQRGDAMHVYCCAPHEALVARVAERMRVDHAEAQRMVDDTNHQRAQYVRTHFGRDWSAPENYDLCVNTSALGITAAGDLVIAAARQRFG
ncbi:MAG: cytidylate kinase-like family protein [Gemmatimonadaceae bacterium]